MNHSDNDILGKLRSDTIVAGLHSLPEPTATGPDSAQARVLDEHYGAVLITYQKKRAKHHKHSHYFWTLKHAEAVPEDPAHPAVIPRPFEMPQHWKGIWESMPLIWKDEEPGPPT